MPLKREQFRRSFVLEIGDKKIESLSGATSLRCAFSVERDKTPEPNNAEVAIWNLNKESRQSLEESAEGVTSRLEVGYQDAVQQVFFGILRKVETIREGADWITHASAGDGEDRIITSRVHKSFARDTLIKDVLRELVKSLELGEGNLHTIPAPAFLKNGGKLSAPYAVSGPADHELTEFTRSIGLEWSVQDGEVQLTEVGKPATGLIVGPLISPDTGLIGSPRLDTKGKVLGTALILPDLVPGAAFQLQSERITGQFLAEKTRHYGDTDAQEWYVDFKGAPIDA